MANLSNINNKLIVTDGGDVMINNTIAGYPNGEGLTVKSSNNICRVVLQNSVSGGSVNDGFRIGLVNSNVEFESTESGEFQFYTGGGAAKMTIDSSGRVGIGETSPDSLLTVGGDFTATTAKPTVSVSNTTSGGSLGIRGLSPILAFDKTSGGVPKILMDGGGVEFKSGTLDAQGDVHLKINSSGNVGIGITPNVNSSVVNVIQLGKGMTLLGNANDDRATMAANLYLDTGTAFRYVMDGLAGRFSIEDGNMVWSTASSGTAGTVATVYTKMTLLNNGNVGIGANSPAEKLHVSAGNIRLDSTVAGGNGILIIYDSSGTQSGQIYGSSGDLKIYSPADVLFNQGGNVGIGTDSPAYKLNVEDSASFLFYGATDATTGSVFRLRSNNKAVTIVDIDAAGNATFTGNVKIGATSPIGTPSTNANDLVIDKGATEAGITIMSTNAATIRFGDAANTSIGFLEYNHTSDYMRFGTNAAEKMRITSGGNVNISTSSGTLAQTSYKLRVESDPGVTNGIYLSAASGNDSALYVENQLGTAELFTVRGDGNIKIPQIGVTTGATAVGVDSSGFIRKLSSSKRYKKDIESIDIGLDFIDSLSPVKFKMKEDDVESVGLIAEDMIDNRFVTYSQIDMKDKSKGLQVEGVNYQALIAPLIKSIQELKADNDTLKARIETLENK